MSVIIGHAGSDSRGKLSGDIAGDQTGREVRTQGWYSRPWNVVLRCTDPEKREKIAAAMEQACANDNIGYDQGDRTSLFYYAKNCDWDISKVESLCECDCSSLVAVCVNAAGIPVSKDIYTGNERKALLATGYFEELTEDKYLTTSDYLIRSDILLLEGHHTAIVLTDGSLTIDVGSWEKSGTSWRFKKPSGEYASSEWIAYKKHWYYFDRFGIMLTGEHKIHSDVHGDELYRFAINELGDELEGSLLHTNERGALVEWLIS